MLPNGIGWSMATGIDKLVLYSMNRRIPDSFGESYGEAPTFEAVLAETAVNHDKTVAYTITAPGQHPVWMDTLQGELECSVRVVPALDPKAPLIIYHHGFNEFPYDNSWKRIFLSGDPLPAHVVLVQAPFHDHWDGPFTQGFASLQSVFQIFAGSLRVMELVQQQFEADGAAFTMLAGVSWGGITSMLYEGVFQSTQAVVPMLSSPNLAQVIWDIAEMFGRDVPVSQQALAHKLDFTPYYERCRAEQVYPLLGEMDQFFQIDKHAEVFGAEHVETIAASHITGMRQGSVLRQHVAMVLETAVAAHNQSLANPTAAKSAS